MQIFTKDIVKYCDCSVVDISVKEINYATRKI